MPNALRKRAVGLCAILALLGGGLGASAARADQLVQVAPHWAPVGLTGQNATPPLLGFLARPYGPGRFPAVVVLHWCSGFSDHDTRAAALLKSWGYVGLALDSLGEANMCQSFGGATAQAADAYAALHYLAGLSFVAPGRVAVLGFSMGGDAVLQAVESGLFQREHQVQFRAAVAYYPACQGSTGLVVAPTLVLIGADDDWSSPEACRRMAAHLSDIGTTREAGPSAPLDLVVYPGATHAFDAPERPRRYLGHFMRYDPIATQNADARVQAFLRLAIGNRPDAH